MRRHRRYLAPQDRLRRLGYREGAMDVLGAITITAALWLLIRLTV